jgi:hypothetical protein
MSCRSANYVAPQLVAQPLHPSASRACALKRRCKGWGFFLCSHPACPSARVLLCLFRSAGFQPASVVRVRHTPLLRVGLCCHHERRTRGPRHACPSARALARLKRCSRAGVGIARDLLFNFFLVGRDPSAHCTTVNGMDASVVSHNNASVPLLPVSGLNSMVNVSTGLASFLTFILVRPKSREES